MRRMLPVVVCLGMVVAAGLGALVGVRGSQGRGQRILWGQCTSHCLARHHDKIQSRQINNTLSGQARPDKVILCRKSRECRWCLFACDRPGDLTDKASCYHDCQNPPQGRQAHQGSCRDSCDFLAEAQASKAGDCPDPGSATQWDAACLQECQVDEHCASYKKCCPNTCGQTCQKPLGVDELLPPKPRHVEFHTRNDGGVVVTWGSEPTKAASSLPVVYILNWWCPYTRQPNFHLTGRDSVRIRGFPHGIHPGEQCSYIVAAVNQHGSLGFTKVYHYIKKITKPSEPVNFRQGGMQESRNRVSVKLEWQPPRVSDLVVWRYTVLWGHTPPIQPIYTHIHMNRKSVPGSRLSYTLKNLLPGTEYFVQVRPVVKWNDKRMRGEPASMYLRTISKPRPGSHSTQSPLYRTGAEDTPIFDIQVQQAIFDQGVLKANISWETDNKSRVEKFMIYWKPEHCQGPPQAGQHPLHLESQATSHDPWFRLYNLRHACQYAVRIHPVIRRGHVLEPAVKRFQTPNCSDIQTTGPVRPDCPDEIPLPGRPGRLGVQVKPRGCGLAAVVTWEAPSPADVIEGYVVLLGESESRASTSSHVVYVSHPQRHDLPADARLLEVEGLQGDRHYSVQVRATSQAGDGPPLLQHFNTPPVVDCISPPPGYTPTQGPLSSTHTPAGPTSPPRLTPSAGKDVGSRGRGRPGVPPSTAPTVPPSVWTSSETEWARSTGAPRDGPGLGAAATTSSPGAAVRTSETPKGSIRAPSGSDVTASSRTPELPRSGDGEGAASPSRDNGSRGTGVGRDWLELWLLTLCLVGVLRWKWR